MTDLREIAVLGLLYTFLYNTSNRLLIAFVTPKVYACKHMNIRKAKNFSKILSVLLHNNKRCSWTIKRSLFFHRSEVHGRPTTSRQISCKEALGKLLPQNTKYCFSYSSRDFSRKKALEKIPENLQIALMH